VILPRLVLFEGIDLLKIAIVILTREQFSSFDYPNLKLNNIILFIP
jgi:hypothetical protein